MRPTSCAAGARAWSFARWSTARAPRPPVVIAAGHASYDFALLLLVTNAAILAGNATHQTPVLSVFMRFFMTGWNASLLVQPWLFPHHWYFILPLSLLHTFTMYRHSHTAHRFFVHQVWLEERGQQLSAQYREARDAAEAALAEKNRFLSTAAHDLRQPVHAMSLMVEAISLRNTDPVLRPLMADLRASMQAMSQLFNALLDLSRLESGQPLGHKTAVDLGALLADVVRLFREQASLGGLTLRLRLPRRGATVWAEPVLLRQALANLVQNAIRYTPQGKVLVSARARGGGWLVEVRDTGIGIAPADQARVFSPYYRGSRADQMDDAGHGLGLAVVARCAEQLGAAYGVHSLAGRGSRFWLRLPAHVATDAGAPTASAAAHRQAVASRPLQGHCLVLDDDPQVLKAWRAMLEAWGVTAAYATTGAEAHGRLDEGLVPDAIFCDQRLRLGESGFDILRTLLARCPAARGAMVSGEFDAPALRDAEDEGYLVLRKPVNPAELHAVLVQWLAHGKSQREPHPVPFQ